MSRASTGHRAVAARLRRVVVARRCTHHPSRRVMVEHPPSGPPGPPPPAGPVPPHGPALFFLARTWTLPPADAGAIRSTPDPRAARLRRADATAPATRRSTRTDGPPDAGHPALPG